MKKIILFGRALYKNSEFKKKNTLESLDKNIIAAYSLNLLRTGYLGSAIRLRRAGDNTEIDIGFNEDGSLNIDAINLFLGGAAGYIKKWYDQSENKINAVQRFKKKQPQLDLSSKQIAIDFNGKNQFLNIQDDSKKSKTYIGRNKDSYFDGQLKEFFIKGN